jgi:hypothetical protein
MLGKNGSILTCTDINSFKEKLTLWGARMIKENKVEIVKLIKSCRLEKESPTNLILQNFSLLSKNIEKYFPSFYISSLDCPRDPFGLSASESAEFNVAEEDDLMDIRNDRRLKLKHPLTGMASFWLSLRQEYPHHHKESE